ncbi:N-acetylmuramoyl-L-alanine amidase [Nocardia inohanensis]|uniref:N-acetylmuramoyl-L-alanine amidase n=1 Tax=Nocardia inohanensis TaxID=209246 RepID=UPI003F76F6F9
MGREGRFFLERRHHMKPSMVKAGICTAVTAAAFSTVAGLIPGAALASPVLPDLPQRLLGKTVFLDPGHQGPNHNQDVARQVNDGRGGTKPCQTTGMSTLNGVPEHTVNWNVAQLVRTSLEGLGARVVLSRPDDTGWGGCIDERAAAANSSNADLAISIHADSAPGAARGFHLIVPQLPIPDAKANEVQGGPGLNASRAMRDAYVQAGFPAATYNGAADGLQTRNDIAGPALTHVPVAFLEMGNGANAEDAQLLESSEGQLKHAVTITTGAVSYLLGMPIPADTEQAAAAPEPAPVAPAQYEAAPQTLPVQPDAGTNPVEQQSVPGAAGVAPQAAGQPGAQAPGVAPQAAPESPLPQAQSQSGTEPQTAGGQQADPKQAKPEQSAAPEVPLPQSPPAGQPGSQPAPGAPQAAVPTSPPPVASEQIRPATAPAAVKPVAAPRNRTPGTDAKPGSQAPGAGTQTGSQSPGTGAGTQSPGAGTQSPGGRNNPGTQSPGANGKNGTGDLDLDSMTSLVQTALQFMGPLAKMLMGQNGVAADLVNLAYSVVSALSSSILTSPAK